MPEHRRRTARTRRVATHGTPPTGIDAHANIAALIDEGGQITLGALYPMACVAVASDGHNSLAMLQRRDNETLAALMARLDAAIARAWDHDEFTDEINPP